MQFRKIKIVFCLAVLLTLLSGIAAVSAQGNRQGPDNGPGAENGQAIGLGEYGRSGPISRDQLPPGIREGASGRAIGLASSPVFAEARAGWDLSSDFVHHIDYQENFRESFDFMDETPEGIANAMVQRFRSEHFDTLRLYLTPAEATELSRRMTLGDQMDALRETLNQDTVQPGNNGNNGRRLGQPNVVMMAQDQMDGGKLVAYVLDDGAPGVRRAVGQVGRSNIEFRVVPYSIAEFEDFQERLGQRVRPLGIDYSLGLRNAETLIVSLEVPVGTALPEDLLDGFPDDAVEILEIDGFETLDSGNPATDHAPSDATAGILAEVTRLSGSTVQCTWGLSGHTNSFNYFVSAGHCFQSGSDISGRFTTDAELGSSLGTYNYTTGERYILSNDSAARGDMGRISGPNSIAGTNCMHWQDNPCAWGMERLARNGTWEVGADMTCGSFGKSNKYECNVIERVNQESGGHTNLVTTRIEIQPGDSGTGMHWGETIDGLQIREGNLRFRKDRVFFHTAEDVRSGLRGSFDFNCWHNGQQNRPPSFWTPCTTVNR